MQFPQPVCSRLCCDTPVSSLPPAVSSIYHNSSHVTAAFLTLKVQLEAGGAKSTQKNPKAPLFSELSLLTWYEEGAGEMGEAKSH